MWGETVEQWDDPITFVDEVTLSEKRNNVNANWVPKIIS